MPIVELGDRGLRVERRGSGEPLLLVTGMAGHHRLWGESFVDALARDFEVVAYDHRGIGDSSPAEEAFTIADLADDASRLLAAIGWDSAHVVGTSMGGMIAQELVIAHPEQVRTVVLGCTYAGPDGGSLEAPGPLRMVEAASTGDVELAMRVSYEANLSAAYRAEAGAAGFEAFTTAALAVKVPRTLIGRQLRAAGRHDAVARLGGVRTPTLVIHGSEDEMLVPANGDHVAGLVPGARLERMDGVGHLFWWERPLETAELIRAHALDRSR